MTLSDLNVPELLAEITTDEGRRLRPYRDTAGVLTIGVGHNLDALGISDAVCDLMLSEDVDRVMADLDVHWPWWRDLPPAQGRVMANMCFNLGWYRLSRFVRFLAAMQAQDWQSAAAELRDSVWWHEVGERGPRMVARLLESAQSKP